MREFLYSEIANIHGLTNLPENPDLDAQLPRIRRAAAAQVARWRRDEARYEARQAAAREVIERFGQEEPKKEKAAV